MRIIRLLTLILALYSPTAFSLVSVKSGVYEICAYWPSRFEGPTLSFNVRSLSALLIKLVGKKTQELKRKGPGNWRVKLKVHEDQERKSLFEATLLEFKKCKKENTIFRVTSNLKPYNPDSK